MLDLLVPNHEAYPCANDAIMRDPTKSSRLSIERKPVDSAGRSTGRFGLLDDTLHARRKTSPGTHGRPATTPR